jgi:hypothetical protein
MIYIEPPSRTHKNIYQHTREKRLCIDQVHTQPKKATQQNSG